MRPSGSNVKGLDLRTLVCRTDDVPIGIQAPVVHYQPVPRGCILSVKRIWRLEPGARKSCIQVDRIHFVQLKVEAIKYVFFIALGVNDCKLRRIEKASAVQPIHGDKIPPLRATIPEVDSSCGSAKTAIGGSNITVGRSHALSRTCGHIDDDACLFAKFGRWRTVNYFQRLDGIQRNLIRENLALLVSNRLAVQRK